ncbi:NUDIX hydrolase [Saccharopolyspora sp. 6V]|uniref:NUDIX hydrolase n=1 Tax=Saccharopolyspora sp. 6V TaxID=2877239 RepID=UPI001CD4D48E|nr:NUDIX hydrolase [Saccharopolyspora sp. 6V]MCA1194183.1 NUDIX hydrolase [Saccharopolyspora sp. 6V]
MTNDSDEWLVHGERTVYDSEWVRVGLADLSQPSGERFEHHTVWFPAPAMTVLIDDAEEHVLMSWRHRFAPGIWNWELPGGIIDAGESPGETAMRELVEETGYRPRSLEPLVAFEPAVGMLRNPNHVFLGRGAELVGDPTEVNEGKFEWVPLHRLPELIHGGQVQNSGTLVGLLHILAFGIGSN